MHTLNLGLVQSLLGSAFRVMADAHVWGNGNREQQYKAAYQEFVAWAKVHKIPQLASKQQHRAI